MTGLCSVAPVPVTSSEDQRGDPQPDDDQGEGRGQERACGDGGRSGDTHALSIRDPEAGVDLALPAIGGGIHGGQHDAVVQATD